ncbi:MAG: (S)-ureidoglycine aminohydrolase [Pseudomonadota bacterium]
MNTTTPQNTAICRTHLAADHVLMAPESHVPIIFPGWNNCSSVVMISPELGAKFSQLLVTCSVDAHLTPLRDTDQTFVMVLEGQATISTPTGQWSCQQDDYVYLPAANSWRIHTPAAATLLMFCKPYSHTALPAPDALHNSLSNIPALPFLGDDGALLQTLLPDTSEFDWGINVFEFVPGATLPQVEMHFMEHGLYMLDGEGIYRLGEQWYPVQAGDAIWMAPYLPQWFAATGKHSSRYIYYKEMNRAPITAS